MPELERLCVFCGSSPATDPAVTDATEALGRELVARGIELVYGGGAVGLMGVLADTVMGASGRVTGVIPSGLFRSETEHRALTRLEEVDTMHVRKARMYELADAFIALPGGFGTLEELAETLTWNQIGILAKPVGVLDVGGFWQPLLTQLDEMARRGLLKPRNRALLLAAGEPGDLLDTLAAAAAGTEPTWTGDQIT